MVEREVGVYHSWIDEVCARGRVILLKCYLVMTGDKLLIVCAVDS